MQAVPRWRSILVLRNSIDFSSTQFASFHSTTVCNDKWKKKWNSDFKKREQPSKNYARYVVRQKRADSKRALNSLLYNSGGLGNAFQSEERSSKANGTSSSNPDIGGNSKNTTKKGRSKSNTSRAQKIHNHKMRRKYRKGFPWEDDDGHPDPETVFHATFGNRWYTWTFNSFAGSPRRSTPGFNWGENFHRDWRENFHRVNDGQEKREAASETDSEDETYNVGSRSDRATLGLPTFGPLKMKDVKNAFHLSALKWHPDKHQGPSQGAAEEKFKHCVNAYKSLCSALSAA